MIKSEAGPQGPACSASRIFKTKWRNHMKATVQPATTGRATHGRGRAVLTRPPRNTPLLDSPFGRRASMGAAPLRPMANFTRRGFILAGSAKPLVLAGITQQDAALTVADHMLY